MTAGAASVRSVGRPRQTRVLRIDRGSLTVCRSSAAHVGEGADGLLRQPEVVVLVQGHDLAVRDRGGEERNDPLVPLPRVHGEEQVVRGFEAPSAQDLGERFPDARVEFLVVEVSGGGDTAHSPVPRYAGADGDPGQ